MAYDLKKPAFSDVRLFGIVFEGATVGGGAHAPPAAQAEKVQASGQQPFMLAQIFSFSCDGRYVPLPSAVLIQVSDAGKSVGAILEGDLGEPIRLLGFAPQKDALPAGLQMWTFNRTDEATRYEVATGTLFDLLVGPAFAAMGVGSVVRRPDIVGQEGNLAGRVSASKMWLW